MKLYVPLRRDEFDRLAELARAERRRPQDQAAVLLEKALNHNADGVSDDLRGRIEAAMRNEPEALEAWALANGIRVAPR